MTQVMVGGVGSVEQLADVGGGRLVHKLRKIKIKKPNT